MLADNSFLTLLGVEISASGHRRWPDAVKAQIVSDTLEPGATVNAVARHSGIQPTQLSTWRRLARQGDLVLPARREAIEPPLFAPLVIQAPVPPAIASPIRIRHGDVTIELASDIPAARIAEIVLSLDPAR